MLHVEAVGADRASGPSHEGAGRKRASGPHGNVGPRGQGPAMDIGVEPNVRPRD